MIEAVKAHNELIEKFNKAEAFYKRHPNYFRTHPKENAEIEGKLKKILKEIDALNVSQYPEVVWNSDATVNVKKVEQVKFF